MEKVVKWMNNFSLETHYIYLRSLKTNNLKPGPLPQILFHNPPSSLQVIPESSICAVLSSHHLKMRCMNSLSGKCIEEGKTFLLNIQDFNKCEANNLRPLCFHMNQCRGCGWQAQQLVMAGQTPVLQGFGISLLRRILLT